MGKKDTSHGDAPKVFCRSASNFTLTSSTNPSFCTREEKKMVIIMICDAVDYDSLGSVLASNMGKKPHSNIEA